MITDGSYKERVHLEADGRLQWASSAGCAWVVGETAAESRETASTWRLIRSHGVHGRTAGERNLSNYEAELYGIIGFLREWTALPWGRDRTWGTLCLWSDCATAVDLIQGRTTRLEVKWRRTAASPAWSEIQRILHGWSDFQAAWIRGHADDKADAQPLTQIQHGNVLADQHAERGRLWAEDNQADQALGPLRTNLVPHLTSGAILWTASTALGPVTIEGNLAKGWRKLNGRKLMHTFLQGGPHRAAQAGDPDIKHWAKAALLNWLNTVFRSKLWGEYLPTADVHARNHGGPSALNGLRICTLCQSADFGDAWHAIGCCTHPELATLRLSVAERLRAACGSITLASTQLRCRNAFADVEEAGTWNRPGAKGVPNHWYGEFPFSWMHDAAAELGVRRGPRHSGGGESGEIDPVRELKSLRLQLRILSQTAVKGAQEIWSTNCKLWRDAELAGPRARAAEQRRLLTENRIYFAAEASFYMAQAPPSCGLSKFNTTAWLEKGREAAERTPSAIDPRRLVRTATLHEIWGRAIQKVQRQQAAAMEAKEDVYRKSSRSIGVG